MIETYLDILDADPSYTLAEALGEARSDFEDAFMEFWGVNAKGPPDDLLDDDWLEARRLWGLSQQIASLGASLVQRKGIGRDRIAEPESLAAEVSRYEQALKELTEQAKKLRPDLTTYDLFKLRSTLRSIPSSPVAKLGVITGALQIRAASLFPWDVASVTERLQTLATFLVRNPAERTRDYLSRVAACYVLELKPEFAVMARAALDAALEDLLDDEAVRARVGGEREVTLERRIQYLRSMGLVDSRAAAAADSIRQAGRDAAHFSPSMVADIDDLLRDLVAVLNALEPLKPPTGGS